MNPNAMFSISYGPVSYTHLATPIILGIVPNENPFYRHVFRKNRPFQRLYADSLALIFGFCYDGAEH